MDACNANSYPLALGRQPNPLGIKDLRPHPEGSRIQRHIQSDILATPDGGQPNELLNVYPLTFLAQNIRRATSALYVSKVAY